MLTRYRIDDLQEHPYRSWQQMGSPQAPTREQIATLRARQELTLAAPPKEVTLTRGGLSLEFELPMPGVQLVLLSRKPLAGPATVKGLRIERFGRRNPAAVERPALASPAHLRSASRWPENQPGGHAGHGLPGARPAGPIQRASVGLLGPERQGVRSSSQP